MRILSLLGMPFLLANIVSAQPEHKTEVFGAIGPGWITDNSGALGKGLNGGGGIGFRVSPKLGLEAEVNAYRQERQFGAQFSRYSSRGAFMVANALRYWGRGRVQCYLIGGGGMLYYRNAADSGGAPGRSGISWAIDMGAGAKIFVRKNLSIRPDLRIFGGSGGGAIDGPFSSTRLSMGAGYHW